jgi:hypothetical protein
MYESFTHDIQQVFATENEILTTFFYMDEVRQAVFTWNIIKLPNRMDS